MGSEFLTHELPKLRETTSKYSASEELEAVFVGRLDLLELRPGVRQVVEAFGSTRTVRNGR